VSPAEQQSIRISRQPDPQQQTRCSGMQRANDGTDDSVLHIVPYCEHCHNIIQLYCLQRIIQSQRGLKWVVLNWTGLQHCQSPWVDVNVNVNVEINVTAGHHVEVYGRKGEERMTRWHHHHQQQQQQQQQQ